MRPISPTIRYHQQFYNSARSNHPLCTDLCTPSTVTPSKHDTSITATAYGFTFPTQSHLCFRDYVRTLAIAHIQSAISNALLCLQPYRESYGVCADCLPFNGGLRQAYHDNGCGALSLYNIFYTMNVMCIFTEIITSLK